MGKFDGVMIASDFDDTFFPESHVLPEANRQAVAYFQSEGGIFTIATGRARTTFRRYVALANPNAPVILANGAQLYDFSREVLVEERTVPETIAADLLELVKLVPEVGLEAYHGEDIYIWNPNEWTWFHLERAKCTAQEREIADMPQPWGKAILHQKNSILKEAQRLFLDRWGDRYEAIFSNFHMLELTGKGTTKGGHGADPVPAAGGAPGGPLLRGGQPKRPPYAGGVRCALCPRRLRTGGQGLRCAPSASQ